jgi:23S rRNA G2445 N2-methylase RlmL
MSYKYATEQINYEDYSSGRVLYNQQGATSFPVRLTSEIFLRCSAILQKSGMYDPYIIYDPMCGGAYALTTLGFLHHNQIGNIYASDVDEDIVGLARKNLSLLTQEGLNVRINQLEHLYQEFNKESHRDALQSGARFQEIITKMQNTIETECFVSDALKPSYEYLPSKIDMVITDLPYGEVVDWVNTEQDADVIKQFLAKLHPVLASHAVVAITSPKKTKINTELFIRMDRFQIGKRQIDILQPL